MIVNFTPIERFILASVLGLLTGFVSAGVFSFDQDLANLVGITVTAFAGIGVVPPTPDTVLPFMANPLVGLILVIAAAFLSYVINKQTDGDTLRGILQGVLTFLASVGIAPPQAVIRHRQVGQTP